MMRATKMSEKCEKCGKCGKKYPWYLLSKVQIWSREFIGKVTICDFCYVDASGSCLREYKGFDGWIRKKLRKIWENKNKDATVGFLVVIKDEMTHKMAEFYDCCQAIGIDNEGFAEDVNQAVYEVSRGKVKFDDFIE
jgi:hypothetical protein